MKSRLHCNHDRVISLNKVCRHIGGGVGYVNNRYFVPVDADSNPVGNWWNDKISTSSSRFFLWPEEATGVLRNAGRILISEILPRGKTKARN